MSRLGTKEPAAGFSRLAAFAIVAGVLAISAAVGRRNAPDRSHPATRRWYKRLDKPGFTPPDAVFGVVWPMLEAGLGAGGYRLLRSPASPQRNLAVGLWIWNTGMVGAWTHLFFRKHALGTSAAASGTMVVSGVAYAVSAAKVDRAAGASAMPFVAWLSFATLLASRVWQRNPKADPATVPQWP